VICSLFDITYRKAHIGHTSDPGLSSFAYHSPLKLYTNVLDTPWSTVGIVTAYELDGRNSTPGKGKIFLSSPQSPDWLWGPPSLFSNGYWVSVPRCTAAEAWSLPPNSIGQEWWNLTSIPHTSSQHGALLHVIKHRDNFTLPYSMICGDSRNLSSFTTSVEPTVSYKTFLYSHKEIREMFRLLQAATRTFSESTHDWLAHSCAWMPGDPP
jgi:hypothetical protein